MIREDGLQGLDEAPLRTFVSGLSGLSSSLCLVLALGLGLHAGAQTSSPPNVIMIVVDDLNDYVFEDGHPTPYAPNVSRLATRATRFLNTHCSSPLCAPSRHSFLTGKDLAYTKIYDNVKINNWRDLFTPAKGNEVVYTIPEVLKDSGNYYTYGINKIFHNFFRPEFDNDYDDSNPDPCTRSKSWSQYETYPDGSVSITPDGIAAYAWGKIPNSDEPQLSDYRATSAAIQFLTDYDNNPADFCDKPFFLALGLVRPHTPHFIPEKYFPEDFVDNIYAEPFDLPYNEPYNQYPPNGFVMPPQPDPIWSDYDDLESMARVMARENKPRHQAFIDYAQELSFLPNIDSALTDSTRRYIVEQSKRANAVMAYWSAVRYFDAQLGRLIDHLESLPEVNDNTVIVLLSDHGYSLGEKTHWHKQALWETDTRIPLLIVDPRREGNQICRRTVSALDVFPTIMELTGVSEPLFPDSSRYLDGMSLVQLIEDPNASWERPVISTTRMGATLSDGSCFDQYSVRSERFHYIRYQTNGTGGCDPVTSEFQEELYEVGPSYDVDPFEWNNLAADNSYRPIMNYLSEWLPGGDNYLSRAYSVRIGVEQIPCILTRNDTIRFSTELRDPQGNIISPPPGTSIRYRVLPFGDQFPGPDVIIPLNGLDSALFASLDQLTFQAALYNSGTGVIALDQRSISVNGNGIPSVSWDVTQDGPMVAIENYVQSGNIAGVFWEFGDTYRTDDYWGSPFDPTFQNVPSSYTYSFPGDYTIRQHVFYGTDPENLCELSRESTVSIQDSLFLGKPCQTPGLVRMEVLNADKALVRWAPVFADETYDLRYKRSRDFDVPWTVVSSNVPSIIIDGLVDGEEYSLSARGVCDTTQTSTRVSDWSFPFRQKAVSCAHPTGLGIDSLAEDAAVLSWDEVNNADFYEVAWRKDGEPFILTPTGLRARIELTGLESGQIYGVGVRTHCPQIFSQEPIAGEFSIPLNFLTPGIPGGRLGNPEKLPDFMLFPNPTEDVLEVRFLNGQVDALVDVYDITGNLKVDSRKMSNGQLKLDVRDWTAGTYVLRLSHGDRMAVRTFNVR